MNSIKIFLLLAHQKEAEIRIRFINRMPYLIVSQIIDKHTSGNN